MNWLNCMTQQRFASPSSGGPSDYSLTLSALTALAVKQGDLPALLKAVRLLLFGSSFYIPPPTPANYSTR